ncbi:MAG: hypothetical protein JWM44_769 [Bacilli bacterium]|nr:hypothetical protein [Bacilli bacterium]
MTRDQLKTLSWLWGFAILAFMASIFITASLLFAFGITITAYHFYISTALTLILLWFAVKRHSPLNLWPTYLLTLLVPGVLFLFFLWISSIFYDITYDGQAYHQETVILLKNGWNPFYDKPLELLTGHAIWINHYARASEVCSSVLYAAFGNIELGKSFNLLLIAGSFFMATASLLTFAFHKIGRAVVVALLLACNPVSIYQSLGFYVDGMLASLLLYLLSLSVILLTLRNRWIYIAFSFCLILTVNVKFTAIGYAGVICIGLLIALYMSEKFDLLKKTLKIGIASALLGVILFGFNPYVTNIVRHGNPFYPLAGTDARDVVAQFTPESFKSMNRLQTLFISNLSVSDENSATRTGTTLKVPFTFSAEELSRFSEPDVAISGFGPLFGGTMILGVIIFILSFRMNLARSFFGLGVVSIVLLSAFINSAAWWARYVPQLWVVPILIALLGLSYERKRTIQVFSYLILAALFLNIALIGQTYVKAQWSANQTLKSELKTFAAINKPMLVNFDYTWSNRTRLDRWGIKYEEKPGDPLTNCTKEVTLFRSGTHLCVPAAK